MQPTIVMPRSFAGNPFGFGGDRFGRFGYSLCQLGCDTTYALCTTGCSALTGGAGAVGCVLICSAAYQACNEGCR